MLHSTSPRPSFGALRVLRQIALYGSFGTAAGTTAYVLEEQRRQICRLSKIVDNGKRVREYVRQTRKQSTSTAQDFSSCIHSLESEGLLTRELVSAGQDFDTLPKNEEGYHYFTAVQDHPRKKKRRKPITTDNNHSHADKQRVSSPYLTYPAKLHHPAQSKSNKPSSTPQAPYRLTRSETPAGRLTARPAKDVQVRQRKLCGTQPVDDGVAETILNSFRLMIANRVNYMDLGDFEEFLCAASRKVTLKPVELLLDDCRAELPWSLPLYPILLRSLAFVGRSAYLEPKSAVSVLCLYRRIMAEGKLEPAQQLVHLYEAGAFELVLDIFHNNPPQKLWTPQELSVIFDSALERVAAGSLNPKPLTEILRLTQDEAIFADLISRIRSRSKTKSKQLSNRYYKTLITALGAACSHNETPYILQLLDDLLYSWSECCRVADLRRQIRRLATIEACSEPWFSKLLSLYLTQPLVDLTELIMWRKMVSFACARGFTRSLVRSFQENYHGALLRSSPTKLAEAYLELGEDLHATVNAQCLNLLICHCYDRGLDKPVVLLFLKYFYTGLLDAGTMTRCWNSTLRSANLEEAVDVLRMAHEAARPPPADEIERVEAALVRRTWLRTRDYNKVQQLYLALVKIHASFAQKPGISQINSILWVSAKAGKFEQARRHGRELLALGQIPGVSGNPHLVFLHARNGLWSKVVDTLSSLHRGGIMASFLSDLGGSFTDIFQAFCEQHSSMESLGFFKRSIETWNVVPDDLMNDHLIASCMGVDGDVAMVSTVVEFIRSRGFDWQIRAQTVVMAFQHYERHLGPDSPLMVRLLCGLNKDHRGLISKNLCLQVLESCSLAARNYNVKITRRVAHTKALLALNLQKRLQKQIAAIEGVALNAPWLSELGSSKPLSQRELGGIKLSRLDKGPREQSQAHYTDMQIATSMNRPFEVVSIYQILVEQRLPRLPLALESVVRACLQLGDRNAAKSFIREAEVAGQSVHNAERILLVDNIRYRNMGPWGTLRAIVFDAYRDMEAHNVPINHNVTVAAVSSLIHARNPDYGGALRILSQVHRSKFAMAKPFGIVPMSCFIAAYGRLGQIQGVRWTIRTILTQNINIDLQFFKTLYTTRKYVVQQLRQRGKRQRAREALALFMTWDALIWRRLQQQRRNKLVVGKAMVQNLVELRLGNDRREAISARGIKRSKLRVRLITNAKESASRSVPLRIGQRLSRQRAGRLQQVVEGRRMKVLRKKEERISLWQGSGLLHEASIATATVGQERMFWERSPASRSVALNNTAGRSIRTGEIWDTVDTFGPTKQRIPEREVVIPFASKHESISLDALSILEPALEDPTPRKKKEKVGKKEQKDAATAKDEWDWSSMSFPTSSQVPITRPSVRD